MSTGQAETTPQIEQIDATTWRQLGRMDFEALAAIGSRLSPAEQGVPSAFFQTY